MQRRLSQKMIVKHDGKTLLEKVFVFAKPYEGYCLVAWVNQGISFGIFCTTVRTIEHETAFTLTAISALHTRNDIVLRGDVILDADPASSRKTTRAFEVSALTTTSSYVKQTLLSLLAPVPRQLFPPCSARPNNKPYLLCRI